MADEDRDIWVWDLQRETMTRMTFDPQVDENPVWTPDGQRLVWASQSAGPFNLYWQAADGTGQVERLTESSTNVHRATSFTPDGQRLLLTEGAAGTVVQQIGMLPLEGDGAVTRLLQTKFVQRNGEISPDGRWLAYESNESGQFQIYVRPFPAVDQGRSQVSTNGGRQPLWARNGRELFFLAPDASLMGVRVDVPQGEVSFAAATPATLIGGSGYYNRDEAGRMYDVTRDGARFLRVKVKEGESNQSIRPSSFVIVQHWHEELKRLVPTN